MDSRIEHMGSTAIEGCPAKPILDVSVGLTPLISLDADVANDLRLIFRAVNPESTLIAIYGPEHLRLANVHVRQQDGESEKWNLIFRDFLRTHPDAVKSYEEIKRAAMGSFPNRAQYSEAKAPFISALRSRIEEWDIARRCEANLCKECAKCSHIVRQGGITKRAGPLGPALISTFTSGGGKI